MVVHQLVGGRGPMCIRAMAGEFLIDPDAVFLEGGKGQPNFRVMSTQRLKMNEATNNSNPIHF